VKHSAALLQMQYWLAEASRRFLPHRSLCSLRRLLTAGAAICMRWRRWLRQRMRGCRRCCCCCRCCLTACGHCIALRCGPGCLCDKRACCVTLAAKGVLAVLDPYAPPVRGGKDGPLLRIVYRHCCRDVCELDEAGQPLLAPHQLELLEPRLVAAAAGRQAGKQAGR
jgi:hypothetical protein